VHCGRSRPAARLRHRRRLRAAGTRMTIPGLLARGRAAHRRLMLDAVRIERRTGRTFDPASGEYVDTWTPVYAGPADVRAQALEAQQRDAGQTDVASNRYDVMIPHSTQ